MDKLIKKILVFLVVAIMVFWAAYKAGVLYKSRMRAKFKIEMDQAASAKINYFYIIDEDDSRKTFQYCSEGDPIIQFYMNEKVRPLLKIHRIRIYNPDGEQVY